MRYELTCQASAVLVSLRTQNLYDLSTLNGLVYYRRECSFTRIVQLDIHGSDLHKIRVEKLKKLTRNCRATSVLAKGV